MEFNHKDGNKLNNSLSNLEIVTKRENILHEWQNGLCKNVGGHNKNPVYKLDHKNSIIERYESIKSASFENGVFEQCVRNNCTGKTRHAKGMLFKYA